MRNSIFQIIISSYLISYLQAGLNSSKESEQISNPTADSTSSVDTERMFRQHYEEHGKLEWTGFIWRVCALTAPNTDNGYYVPEEVELKTMDVVLETLACEKIQAQLIICSYKWCNAYMKCSPALHTAVRSAFVKGPDGDIYKMYLSSKKCNDDQSYIIEKHIHSIWI